MNQTSIKQLLSTAPDEKTVTVSGWIRTKRESKTFCFLALNDGSCLANLQVVMDENLEGYHDLLPQLTTGSSVTVTGTLVASPGKEQAVECRAQAIELIGAADPQSYPLQKKRHSFEFLREMNHLRSRTNTMGAVMRVRHALSMAIHRFFDERGFFYIHTPIITGSDCEGAGQQFQVTTLPLEQVPKKEGQIDYEQEFFRQKAALTVSGQLEAESLALALGKVYTFGPTFRAEHSGTSRHLAEFWMVEPEMAFCDIHGDMDVAEAFLKTIIKDVLETCPQEMAFFDQWIEQGLLGHLQALTTRTFERITYTEAIERLEAATQSFEFPVHWGMDLQSEHEKYLTEKVYQKPVMVTNYPKEIKAFYMKLNDDDKTVRALDVLAPRLGEIIGGSEREDNESLLRQRMTAAGITPEDYAWYLDLRRFGSVPHAGFGLGFERMVQFITGMQNIRDVIAFPRAYGGGKL